MAVLIASDLSKDMAGNPLLRGVSFKLERRDRLTIAGRNGAGKTTLLRMLATLLRPHAGEVRVLGRPLPADGYAVRGQIGFLGHEALLYRELSGRENLRFYARLHRVSQARADEVLDAVGMTARGNDPVAELSRGMVQRLAIARAVLHEPELLLLDEPTVGLDPQVRSELWALVDELRSEGVTILMSTHYIEEAERLADEVAIMAEGRIVARGRPHELVGEHVGREVVEVYGPPAQLREAEQRAVGEGYATRRSGPALAILGAERANGAVPEGYRRPASLEDVFVVLTGAEIE